MNTLIEARQLIKLIVPEVEMMAAQERVAHAFCRVE
jgi:hypothetical protein